MFFDLSARKIDDKWVGSFRVVQKLAMWLLNSCLMKNLFGGAKYLGQETSNKTKNLVLYLKQHTLQDYVCLARI
jgi:hypothetical protein